MLNEFARTELVIGRDAMDCMKAARVAVFGVGGVGGNCIEALARCGIGTLDLIDDDRICLTNINRQVFATHKTVGKYKVDAAEERIHEISPKTVVNKYKMFYLPSTRDQIDFNQFDYIIDAIDTVTAKLDIIEQAVACHVPIISSMGCGNRVDPSKLVIKDIYETSGDPLARVMRRELRKRGIQKLTVCCSTEKPLRPLDIDDLSCRYHCVCPPGTERKCTDRRDIPGSTSFVPPAAGIMIASYVMRDLSSFDPEHRVRPRTWAEEYRRDHAQ